jgi:RNase adapter protein RapZ
MKPTIVIITGLAGSGKSVALRALEDIGFYCVDNLPLPLVEPLTDMVTGSNQHISIGIGIDIREKEFLYTFEPVLTSLRGKYMEEVIFLEAEKDALMRRYKETRRPHPLVSGGVSIEEAIDTEKTMLLPLRREADRIIDTSSYTPHQLRTMIISLFRTTMPSGTMAVTLISFGYKFGLPQNIDLLFDVRFIPNPHFIPELRDLRGTDEEVRDFVVENPLTLEFLDRTAGLINFLIPQYLREGKAYLIVGIGCTGGRHRSPAVVEKIASLIKGHPVGITVIHRDME